MLYDDFTKMTCGECGISHYIPTPLYDENKKLGKKGPGWHCPNGHSRVFSKGDADRFQRERDRLKQQLAMKDDLLRNEREFSEKTKRLATSRLGQITKLKNRANNGLCPCCNRTFQNLHRHMKSKHPDYANQDMEGVSNE